MNSPTWLDALAKTHYLHQDQLSQYFAFRLEHVKAANHPDVVIYQNALWWKDAFRQARHVGHRRLVAEIYCRLIPAQSTWQVCSGMTSPQADAILKTDLGPIYLEADTGKENRRQWATKLSQYQQLRQGALWVIAEGGSLRLERLEQWVSDANLRLPWALTPIADVGSAWPRFEGLAPKALEPEDPSPHLEVWQEYHRLGPDEIPPEHVKSLLDQGVIEERARQRLHNGVIHHYGKKTFCQQMTRRVKPGATGHKSEEPSERN